MSEASDRPIHTLWRGDALVGIALVALVAGLVIVWQFSDGWGFLATIIAVPLGLSLAFGLDRAGMLLVATGMFFAPLISLQPITPPPVVTWADVFFTLGFALLVPQLLRKPLRAPALFLCGAMLLLSFALIAIAIHGEVGPNVSGALRLAYAAVALPLAFRWWDPSPGRVALLVTGYLAGNLYSLGHALVEGPLDDGRLYGLATHPNGFGISLALALSLVPFIAWRMRDMGWLAYVAALVGGYGVYASGSRAALIVVLLIIVAHLVIERSSGALVLIVLAAIGVLTATALRLTTESNALGRLFGATDAADSDAQRRALLQAGLEQMKEHPFLGGGFEHIRAAHNIYVQVGASIGVIALVGFLMILLALLMPLRTAPARWHRLAYPALAYVLVGPLTDTLTDTSVWAPVCLAILAASPARRTDLPFGSAAEGESAEEPRQGDVDATVRLHSGEAPR